jgi:hypothetical protein
MAKKFDLSIRLKIHGNDKSVVTIVVVVGIVVVEILRLIF